MRCASLNTKLGFRICCLLIKTFIEFKGYVMNYIEPIPQDMKDLKNKSNKPIHHEIKNASNTITARILTPTLC